MVVLGAKDARQPCLAAGSVQGIARNRVSVAGDRDDARRLLFAIAVDDEPRHAAQNRRVDRPALDQQRRHLRNPDVDRDMLRQQRSEEHTSELQSLMRISYAVFCLKKNTHKNMYKHTSYETK